MDIHRNTTYDISAEGTYSTPFLIEYAASDESFGIVHSDLVGGFSIRLNREQLTELRAEIDAALAGERKAGER